MRAAGAICIPLNIRAQIGVGQPVIDLSFSSIALASAENCAPINWCFSSNRMRNSKFAFAELSHGDTAADERRVA